MALLLLLSSLEISFDKYGKSTGSNGRPLPIGFIRSWRCVRWPASGSMPVGEVDRDDDVEDRFEDEDGDELHISTLLLLESELRPFSAGPPVLWFSLSSAAMNWWYGDRVRACIRIGRYCCSTFHSDPFPMF